MNKKDKTKLPDSSLNIRGSGDMARKAEGFVNERLGNEGRQRLGSNSKSMQGFIDIHLNLSQLAIIAAFGITLSVGVSAYLDQHAQEEHKSNLVEKIESGELDALGFLRGDYADINIAGTSSFLKIGASSFGYIEGEDSYGCIEISSYAGNKLRCEEMAPEDVISFLDVDLSEITSAEFLDKGVYKFSVNGVLTCIAAIKDSSPNNSFSISCPSSNGDGFDKNFSFSPEDKISVRVDGVETISKELTSVVKLSDIDYLGNGHKQETEELLERLQKTYGNHELKKGAKYGV